MAREIKMVMLWDCPYCGTKGNLGSERTCKCGRGRGEDVKFYPPGNLKVGDRISNEDLAILVPASSLESTNPDWYCEHCDTYNSDARNTCKNCGASRYKETKNYAEINAGKKDLSDSAKNYRPDGWYCEACGTRNEEGTTVCKNCGAKKDAPKHADTAMKRENEVDVQETPANPWKIYLPKFTGKYIKGGIIAGLMVLVIVGLVMFFNQKIDIEVEELRWEYSIEVEQYRHLYESDWTLPAGGELDYTNLEIHHYESVLDHYETRAVQRSETYVDHYETTYEYGGDDGNGYGTVRTHETPVYRTRYWTEYVDEPVYRNEPVYRTKYYYYIWRWVYARTEKNRGKSGDNSDPSFPKPTLNDKERLGKKKKEYTMTARVLNKKNSETKDYKLSEEVWRILKVGDKLTVGAFVDEITGFEKE